MGNKKTKTLLLKEVVSVTIKMKDGSEKTLKCYLPESVLSDAISFNRFEVLPYVVFLNKHKSIINASPGFLYFTTYPSPTPQQCLRPAVPVQQGDSMPQPLHPHRTKNAERWANAVPQPYRPRE